MAERKVDFVGEKRHRCRYWMACRTVASWTVKLATDVMGEWEGAEPAGVWEGTDTLGGEGSNVVLGVGMGICQSPLGERWPESTGLSDWGSWMTT